MGSTEVELHNLDKLNCHNQPSPPYTVVVNQPTRITDLSPLPAPVVVQPPEVEIVKYPDFQRYRQQVICKSCRQQVVTKTEHRISGGTWCMCCVVFFVGGFLCCFIPFLMNSCKDVVHRCPECNTELGRRTVM